MVADVVIAAPRALDPPPPPPVPARARRGRRVIATTLLVLGGVFTGLCLLVLGSSWHDDGQIEAHRGEVVADVLSVEFNRTAVRFVTPDGTINTPSNGVLYPDGLVVGDRVWVEYDTANPDLVRIAGRTASLALLPVGTSILACWALVGPAVWLLRRRPRPSLATGTGADALSGAAPPDSTS